MSAVAYAFQEAIVSLRRSARSAAMSVGTIAIAFLTLGGFVLLSSNVSSIVTRWASAAEMSVYLQDGVDDATREALAAELRGHGAVAAVEYVSKEAALDRFKSDFPELADVAVAAENPFPPSLEVRLRTDPGAADAAAAMAEQIAGRAGVIDVRYDRQWLSRLQAAVTSARISGLVIAAVLVLGAAFTVNAVVRLSLQARHEELDIMQLVGAPFSFIRGPAIVEGLIVGGVGAIVALAVLRVLHGLFGAQVNAALAAWGSVGELHFLSWTEGTLLVVAGLAVGALSGAVASRAVH